jgi:hypothetical protein
MNQTGSRLELLNGINGSTLHLSMVAVAWGHPSRVCSRHPSSALTMSANTAHSPKNTPKSPINPRAVSVLLVVLLAPVPVVI